MPLSAAQRSGKLIQKTEENMLPGIPRQQPIYNPSSRRENLRRNIRHRGAKRAEVIRNNRRFSSRCTFRQRPVSGNTSAAQASGSRPTTPSPCTPNSRASHRRRHERANPALKLRQQVFLIASLVGVEDDRFGRLRLVVRDVEKAACVVEQLFLPLVNVQILPNHPTR